MVSGTASAGAQTGSPKPMWRGGAFDVLNVGLLSFVGLLALYPFWYLVVISFSGTAGFGHGLALWPRHFSWSAYQMVWSYPEILVGFTNSVGRTVIGTTLSLLFSCLTAYPLANKDLPHRPMFIFIIIVTMVFSGGIVPMYLLVKNLGLLNSPLALILPQLLSAFNIIIIKNYFESIPLSYGEAARMEGAGEWAILFKIYIPLSLPVLATVALWTAVFHWNSWFDAMLYISDDHKQVLQNIVQRIVIDGSTDMIDGIASNGGSGDAFKAACIVITVLPMIVIYPFIQRFFVKGINLGGVKE